MAPESAEALKANGNRLFQQQRYTEAVEEYSKAVIKNPQVASYFTNRALCYIKLQQYQKAADDCRKAAELDRNSVKAYYFWGTAAIQLQCFDEAIKLLTKANELAIGQKVSFGDEIHNQMRLARREKFRQKEDRRIAQEITLQSYLNSLIEADIERKIKELNAGNVTSDEEKEKSLHEEAPSTSNAFSKGDTLEVSKESTIGEFGEETESDAPTDSEIRREALLQDAVQKKKMLNELFMQVDDRRRRRELPDYLCGKISFELLRDPVITPSGITYDRHDIKEHLQKVGHFDPITRTPLSEEQLVPNLAMKEVVEHFLSQNEWAEYEELLDETGR